MKATAVYLVRHTEPVLPDKSRRFVGQADLPLSVAGIDQAHRLADRLGQIDFDVVYASDLRRCLTTAEIIVAKAGTAGQTKSAPRVRPDPRLREIDAGLWEMLGFDEARRSYPREYAERERDLVGFRFPQGESFPELQRRVVAAFGDIVEQGDDSILVVAHRGANRVLLCHLLGRPLEELFSIRQEYGCVNLIRISVLPDGSLRTTVDSQPGYAAISES